MKMFKKKNIIMIFIVLLMGAAALGFLYNSNGRAVNYRTEKLSRGELIVTIPNTTGTVEPEEVVDVGAQVAGKIISFGKDKDGKDIDYGSEVEEGTVLAQIDDALYKSDVEEANAQLIQAKAGLQRAEADLEQMQARLYQAERDWQRAQKLGPSEALSQSSFDAYKSGFEIAKANVDITQAAVEQAKAAVTQAQAALERSERNLGYCTIKSPVKGIIIDRRVNIGQTVVSSFNAPSLFLIAQDLKRMQVWVPVNETDIGNIQPGQTVSFTVEAFHGEIFEGEVGKVRLNANMTQNVVTYTVEVITDNSSGKLLPYLTANVTFELYRKQDVLMVPKEALRWSPLPKQVVPEFRKYFESTENDNRPENVQQTSSDASAEKNESSNERILWIKEGNFVRPVVVTMGASNDTMAEVTGEDLKEGLEFVVGVQEDVEVQGNNPTNPFIPQFRRRR